MNSTPFSAELLDAPDDLIAFNDWAIQRGWSDGLPLIPPTPDRVSAMLDGIGDPTRLIARVPPRYGDATVEAIAINSVLAGCRPAYLPIIVATTQAMVDVRVNLYGAQTTTHPCGLMVMVNGPVGRGVGIHGGVGCFGPGFHANATIGRAIRLILANIGGARPGEGDQATQGSPAKFSFCFSENEAANPWSPYHVELGFSPDQSTVTVVAAEGPHNINDHVSTEPSLLLLTFARTIASIGKNNAYIRDSDYFVGIGPEHAHVLSRGGWSKKDIREFLFAHATIPFRDWRRGGMYGMFPQPRYLEEANDDTAVPMSEAPDDIRLIVVGGDGKHSCWIPTMAFGRSMTAPISALRST